MLRYLHAWMRAFENNEGGPEQIQAMWDCLASCRSEWPRSPTTEFVKAVSSAAVTARKGDSAEAVLLLREAASGRRRVAVNRWERSVPNQDASELQQLAGAALRVARRLGYRAGSVVVVLVGDDDGAPTGARGAREVERNVEPGFSGGLVDRGLLAFADAGPPDRAVPEGWRVLPGGRTAGEHPRARQGSSLRAVEPAGGSVTPRGDSCA